MNKVQFFSDPDVAALQDGINEWLSKNGDIQIIQSNIHSIVKPDLLGNMKSIENHVFYILYSTARKRKNHAAAYEANTANHRK